MILLQIGLVSAIGGGYLGSVRERLGRSLGETRQVSMWSFGIQNHVTVGNSGMA